MQPKIVQLHPFPFDLLAFYWKDKDKSRQWLMEELWEKDSDSIIGEFTKWKTVQSPAWWIFLWTEDKDISCLAHEAFHVCEYLFSKIGIKYDYESGELWAYMIQYVINECVKEKLKNSYVKSMPNQIKASPNRQKAHKPTKDKGSSKARKYSSPKKLGDNPHKK